MQRFALLCVLILMHNTMNACNICGCSAINGNPGILPGFRYHLVGVRQYHRAFNSEHPASILNPEKSMVYDNYTTTELWGRWFPLKYLQVFGALPYNHYTTKENGILSSRSGLGDVSLLANLLLINTLDSNRKFRHLLSAGTGVKWNTGKFISDGHPYFQVGSGTKDVRFYSSYTMTSDWGGFISEFNYGLPGINPEGYQSGQKQQASIRLFGVLQKNAFRFLPNAGVNHESSRMDRLKGIIQSNTGGHLSTVSAGLDVYYKNFIFNSLINLPFAQHLGEGLVKENNRIQIGLAYLIRNPKKQTCN